MPVENSWYVEGRIYHIQLIEDVTVEELAESNRVGTPMIDQGIAPVYIIVNMTDLKNNPTNLARLSQISNQGISDKAGYTVIVGIPNPVVRFITTFFMRWIDMPCRLVDTFDDALEFIYEQDETIRKPVSK